MLLSFGRSVQPQLGKESLYERSIAPYAWVTCPKDAGVAERQEFGVTLVRDVAGKMSSVAPDTTNKVFAAPPPPHG